MLEENNVLSYKSRDKTVHFNVHIYNHNHISLILDITINKIQYGKVDIVIGEGIVSNKNPKKT